MGATITSKKIQLQEGTTPATPPAGEVALYVDSATGKYRAIDENGVDILLADNIELQKSATHIQWKYTEDGAWQDLVPLTDIKGDQGIQGIQGEPGLNGADAVAGKLPSAYVDRHSPIGTTSATLEVVTGMETTITLEEAVEISVIASFEIATISGASASKIALAIEINGTIYDEYSRYLSGTDDAGIGSIVHRSNELPAGTYTVRLYFRRVEGVSTPGINSADMLVMAMQGAKGEQGIQGIQGEPGEGVPAGGTAGQRIAKVDGTDYNTGWVDNSASLVTVDTTNFNLNLSGTDTTVQTALETLDDLVAGGGGGIALETTVATYAELITALGAGTKRIGITADLTATANLAVGDDVWLIGLGGKRTLTMGNYYFESSGTTVTYRQVWKNLSITGTAGQIWYYQAGFDGLLMENCTLSGGATGSRYYWFAGSTSYAQTWRGRFINCDIDRGTSSGQRTQIVYGWAVTVTDLLFENCKIQFNSGSKGIVDLFNGTNNRVAFKNCQFPVWNVDYFMEGTGDPIDLTVVLDNCYFDGDRDPVFLMGSSIAYHLVILGGKLVFNGNSLTDNTAGRGSITCINTHFVGNIDIFYGSTNNGNVTVKLLGCVFDNSSGVKLMRTGATMTSIPRYIFNGVAGVYSNRASIDMSDSEVMTAKNVSGGAITYGSACIYGVGSDADGSRMAITTTTTLDNPLFVGISCDNSIANTSNGAVISKGYVPYAKVDGTADIAFGDTLGTFTTAGVLAKSTTAGARVGIALGAYTTDDSNGTIPVYLWGGVR